MRILEAGLFLLFAGCACALGGTPALAWSLTGVVAGVVLIVALVMGALRDSKARLFLLWPAIFLAYCGVSALWSAVPARTAFFISQWGAYFSTGFVAFFCVRQGRGEWFFKALVWFASLESLYGLVQYLSGYQRIFWYRKTKYLEEATGTYLNHNHFAGLMAMTLPIALAFGASKILRRDRSGHLYVAAAGLLLLGVVFSRSRMGIVSAIVSQVLFSSYLALKVGKRIVAAWLVAVPAIVLAYSVWIGLRPVGARFAALSQREYLGSEGRLAIWKDTSRLVKQRPLLGWGAGTFPAIYPRVRSQPSDLRWMEAHNDYLQFVCELGLAGALAFFGPLFWGIAKLWQRAWVAARMEGLWAAAIGSSLTALLLHELADFHFYVPANAILFIVLASMGAAGLASANHRPPPLFSSPGAGSSPLPGDRW